MVGRQIRGRMSAKYFLVGEEGVAAARRRFVRGFYDRGFPIGKGNDLRDELFNFVSRRRTPEF